jgi:hypothetical protein
MASKVVPLSLTNDERRIVSEYLAEFHAWNDLRFSGDPLDASNITEYLCMCDRMRARFTELYEQIPQIVKDDYIIPRPEYPHTPRMVKRSPSYSRIIEVIW